MRTSEMRCIFIAGLFYSSLFSTVWACPCYDIPVTPLYQNDYPDKIDNSNQTIAEFGCTLTAWTMKLNHAISEAELHVRNPDGTKGSLITYTPSDINSLLKNYRYEQKTYKKDVSGNFVREGGRLVVERVETKNGWGLTIGTDGKPIGSTTAINMGALFKAVEKDTKARSFEGKGLKQESYRAPGWSGIPKDIPTTGVVLDKNYLRILTELENGRPVVVRVATNTHSVLITSFHNKVGEDRGVGRYDIKDPWRKADGSSIDWLDDPSYKNRIFSWDTGVFRAGGLNQPFGVPSDYYIDPLLLTDIEANPDYYGPQIFRANHVAEPHSLALIAMGFIGLLFSLYVLPRQRIN